MNASVADPGRLSRMPTTIFRNCWESRHSQELGGGGFVMSRCDVQPPRDTPPTLSLTPPTFGGGPGSFRIISEGPRTSLQPQHLHEPFQVAEPPHRNGPGVQSPDLGSCPSTRGCRALPERSGASVMKEGPLPEPTCVFTVVPLSISATPQDQHGKCKPDHSRGHRLPLAFPSKRG